MYPTTNLLVMIICCWITQLVVKPRNSEDIALNYKPLEMGLITIPNMMIVQKHISTAYDFPAVYSSYSVSVHQLEFQ
jgi:hypothetical protein